MAKKENSKENKHFFRDFKAEIKKVIWPAPKQLVNTTVAIITMIIVVAVIVFVLDFAFEALSKHGFTNLQQAVISSNENNVNNENKASDNSTNTTNVETTTNNVNENETTQETTESE